MPFTIPNPISKTVIKNDPRKEVVQLTEAFIRSVRIEFLHGEDDKGVVYADLDVDFGLGNIEGAKLRRRFLRNVQIKRADLTDVLAQLEALVFGELKAQEIDATGVLEVTKTPGRKGVEDAIAAAEAASAAEVPVKGPEEELQP